MAETISERQQHADAVYAFIHQYVEIHKKPPTLQQCADACRLSEYRVQRSVARLRGQNKLSQSSLRPVSARWSKKDGDGTP